MCQHNNKIGDNYGMSCQDCGERLEGYGYWAHEKDCLHRFLPVGDTEEICTYCEMWRRKDNPQRDAKLQAAEIKKNGWYEIPDGTEPSPIISGGEVLYPSYPKTNDEMPF